MKQEERFTIKDLPLEERPREKLRLLGAEALSNAELLAICSAAVPPGMAVQLAEGCFPAAGLRALPDLTLEEMEESRPRPAGR